MPKRLKFLALTALLFIATTGHADPARKIVAGAYNEVNNGTRYNPAMLEHYHAPVFRNGKKIGRPVYPNGDVDPSEGICADLVVRALRHAGMDLQQSVHIDLLANKKRYGVKTPDKYSDHRRVWILKTFFERHWTRLPVALDDPAQWRSGDVVIWDIGSKRHLHIGIIGNQKRKDGLPLVIHNMRYLLLVFAGKTVEQDILGGPKLLGFKVGRWKIIGHYRVR